MSSWRHAARAYIRAYQLQRMLSITHAPPSLQLHYRVMRKNGLRYRIAQHGYYDPTNHNRKDTR